MALEWVTQRIADPKQYPPLTPEEQRALGKRARAGDEDAVDLLVKHNVRLAIRAAHRTQRRCQCDIDEAGLEALAHLVTAAKAYNGECDFPLFATTVIRKRMAWSEGRLHIKPVKPPYRTPEEIACVLNIALGDGRPGPKMTAEEIAEEIPKGSLTRLNYVNFKKESGLHHRELTRLGLVRGVLTRLWRTAHMDAPFEADDKFDAGERLGVFGASHAPSQEDEVNAGELAEVLAGALDEIPTQQADIIRRYYGVGCEPETLVAIGEDYGVTGERVRQIREKGLAKLRWLVCEDEVAI